ncbi:TolB protein [Oikeobacillus pervagus]|uniref:TolB protein n=1 Tax=Oikeobacillus pervagus TaxID=1325931 RepID=A0AAJ1T2A7_9BACI|nr:hypothetical protein [Oikeobacillus pervagus]MDQ0215877.1 TolB protein [Oikeobacillus pervagus]
MTKKKQFIIITEILVFIAISLIWFGISKSKQTDEAAHLGKQFDLSNGDQSIVYVVTQKDQSFLKIVDVKGEKTKEIYVEDQAEMVSPIFSNDGKSVYAVLQSKNDEKQESRIIEVTIENGTVQERYKTKGMITEIVLSPKGGQLFFLGADVFKNYSPIASKRPHDFKIYELSLENNKAKALTKKNEYDMSSLFISEDGNTLYVSMVEEMDKKDSFEIHDKIYRYPLNNEGELQKYKGIHSDRDIYSFAISPKGKQWVYTSVANPDTKGNFEYELFLSNGAEEKQLTRIGRYAGNPVFTSSGDEIYFIVDEQFGTQEADYSLYKMNVSEGEWKKVELPI